MRLMLGLDNRQQNNVHQSNSLLLDWWHFSTEERLAIKLISLSGNIAIRLIGCQDNLVLQ